MGTPLTTPMRVTEKVGMNALKFSFSNKLLVIKELASKYVVKETTRRLRPIFLNFRLLYP